MSQRLFFFVREGFMDFEDILNEWEQGRRRNSSSRGKTSRKKKNPVSGAMQKWLDSHGVEDKDAPRGRENRRPGEQSHPRSWPIDKKIDLHGLTAEEAEAYLDGVVSDCLRRGWRKVLIIHGKGLHSKGGGVLRDVVIRFIERDPRMGMWSPAAKQDGGSGALWTVIRAQRSR